MTPAQQREEALFQTAAQLTGAERAAFLDGACHGDPALRQRLEALLAGHRAAEFAAPAGNAEPNRPVVALEHAATVLISELDRSVAAVEEILGTTIGPYKLRETIGEGGCGTVYVADQEKPVRRRVALKVIKLGMDTREVIARFEAERQALAMMDHPNIAKVLDAGATSAGRPYFVMELVRGTKITDYCDQAHLSTKERLDLFIKVCQAIQHAHQKGIIHRDIKPSNILVTLRDGVPVPKVIDFGIAKATEGRLADATVYTQLNQFMGTPAYISPEQAEMSGLDIDTRSDIYSLGVLLYQLLTGKTPFDGKELMAQGLDEMRKTIREKEPARPSTRFATLQVEELTTAARRRSSDAPKLIRLLRGDLDWIVMKCLEKDRTRRYDTANGLAMELQRHLRNEPVIARPPNRIYRLQKLVGRNKLACGAVAAITATLILGLGFSSWQYFEKSRAYGRAVNAEQQQNRLRAAAERAAEAEARLRREAEAQQIRTRQNLYAADLYLVQHALEDGNYGLALRTLEAHRPQPGQAEVRGWEWRYFWQLCQGDSLETWPAHSSVVTALALSPDGRTLASSSSDETVKLWNLDTGRLAKTLPEFRGRLNSVAFSPDGRLLAAGSDTSQATLWDLAAEKVVATFDGSMPRVTFSPVQGLLAIGTGGNFLGQGNSPTVRIWDSATQKTLRTFSRSGSRSAFSPDGQTVAIGSFENSVRLWSLTTGLETRVLTNSQTVIALAFSPDGKTLAASTWEGPVYLWDTTTGQRGIPLSGHTSRVLSLAFAPDGQTIATASSDQTIGLWDATTHQSKGYLKGHASEVWSVLFMPGGRKLLSAGKDETIKTWNAESKEDPGRTVDRSGRINGRPVFSENGIHVATGPGPGDDVQVWELSTKTLKAVLPHAHRAVAFTEQGRVLVTMTTNYILRFWDWPQPRLQQEIVFSTTEEPMAECRLDQRGRCLVTSTGGGKISFWDPSNGSRRGGMQADRIALHEMAFSPDGQWLATGGSESGVRIFDVETRTERAILRSHKGPVTDIAFSPDGQLVLTGSSDGSAKLWEVGGWKELATLTGHKEGLTRIAFSTDGRTLATAGDDRVVKLWHVATRRELVTFKTGTGVRYMRFSPDGRMLCAGTYDRALVLWIAPILAEIDQALAPPSGTRPNP